MNILRGAVAVLFLAAVVAAGVVLTHGSGKVDQAGAEIGYTPPIRGQRLLVIGDSFSVSPDTTQKNWVTLFTEANQMTPISNVQPDTGYLVGGKKSSFLARINAIRDRLTAATASASSSGGALPATAAPMKPNWIIIWDAWDDFADVKSLNNKAIAAKRHLLAKKMQATLRSAKQLVPAGHLIVVGPADGPQIDETVAGQFDQTESSVATQLNLPYVSPVQGHWFTTDPNTGQNNSGFISVNHSPTDAGQVHILYEMESALANLPHVRLRQNGAQATDPVPPVLPTVTVTVPSP